MRLFSQRKGLKKDRIEIQINSMDKGLRNRLWNLFEKYYIFPMIDFSGFDNIMTSLMAEFFDLYLKEKINHAPKNYSSIYEFCSKIFSEAEWYAVYDFLEFSF